MVTVTVAGRINDGGFWRARRAAMHAIADDATLEDADLRPFTSPFEYEVFLESTRKVGSVWVAAGHYRLAPMLTYRASASALVQRAV